MSKTYEVLSAFLDDEPFDPRDLDAAVSDEAGRALLIDLMALRRIVQPSEPPPSIQMPTRVHGWHVTAAAAAVVLALAGGYVAGARRAPAASADVPAPAPSRVVQAVPFVPAGGPQ
jgi:hypothetical protein